MQTQIRNPQTTFRNRAAARRRGHQAAYAPRSPHHLPPLARGGRGGAPRSAFTLVELMIVIVVISILLSLLLPAINAARIRANEARVVTEINQLASAIAAFKAKYGVEPPSQCTIYTTAAGWTGNPAAVATIKRIWPQFDFSYSQTNAIPAYWSNIATTTANDKNPALRMNSGECMLFFLGGIISVQGPGQSPTGFAKNPLVPFAPITASASREGPFFEFSDASRINDLDGNGIMEWYDPIPNQSKPYLYFSAYEGRGYSAVELPNNGTSFGIYNASGTLLCDCLHDFYRTSSNAGIYPLATPTSSISGTSADPTVAAAQKGQSFQIISPGYDNEYGSGGVFNLNLPNSGLVGYDTANSNAQLAPDKRQWDNLTNFNAGRLNP